MLFAFVLAFFVSYILNPYVNALEGLLRCRLIAVCAVIAFPEIFYLAFDMHSICHFHQIDIMA